MEVFQNPVPVLLLVLYKSKHGNLLVFYGFTVSLDLSGT
jgi:hypothetical protein